MTLSLTINETLKHDGSHRCPSQLMQESDSGGDSLAIGV